MTRGRAKDSPFLQALAVDNSIPIDRKAVELWLADMRNPLRWIVRPLLQLIFAVVLHVTWFLKRLPLPQFSAHGLLQKTICWFCRNFVSAEANQLILRHFATESNILNFLRENSGGSQEVQPVRLYPRNIDEMLQHTFVDHDQELFRIMRELGPWSAGVASDSASAQGLKWATWQPIPPSFDIEERRWTQIIDFETAHALFMCLFCLLLTADEYRDAINGFNLDQSIAIRIGQLIGEPYLPELAYNKFPLYLVGPWNLGQRFLMHGFFTEHLHARLEAVRSRYEATASGQ